MRCLVLVLITLLCSAVQAQTFSSSAGGPIPDGIATAANSYGAPLDVPIVVSGIAQGTIDTVRIAFNANHTWVGDLEVTLISPYGQEHLLFARTGATGTGGGSPADLVANNTYTFEDPAATNWWTVANSTNANFIVPSSISRTVVAGGPDVSDPPPLSSMLDLFKRRPPNGTWILRFRDGWAGDIGAVTNASITLSTTGVTRTVTKVEDTNDGNCDADCSLREAIVASSRGNISVDRIEFARPFFATPRRIVLTSGVNLNPTSVFALVGPGVHLLTVSGAGRHEFSLAGNGVSDTRMTFSGFRMTDMESVTLEGVNVVSQMEFAYGGSVGVWDGEVNDSSFHSNRTSGPVLFSIFDTELRRVTISSNISTPGTYGVGGFSSSGGSVLKDCTIVGNRATGNGSVAGVKADSLVLLQNSVIADNRAIGGSVAGQDISGSFQSLGHNLIGDAGTVTTINQPSDQTGTAANPRNPFLSPLSRHGGSLPVHVPLIGSPLLDQGRRVGRDTRGVGLVDLGDINNSSTGNGADIGAVEQSPMLVTNLNDNGPGSLRQILQDAPADPAVSDVLFSVPLPAAAKIVLTSGELRINKNLAIHGPGAKLLTISGNQQSRVVAVEDNRRVSITGLTLADGNSLGGTPGGLGGIVASLPGSQLSIHSSVLKNGSAALSFGGWGILNAFGEFIGSTAMETRADASIGALSLASSSMLVLHRSTVSGCSASCVSISAGSDASILDSTISGAGTEVVLSSGQLLARNSLLAGRATFSGPVISAGKNLFSATDSTFVHGQADQVGTLANPLDARISPLAFHGGAVPTQVPLAGSPALDKGLRFGMDARGLLSFDIAAIPIATGGDNSDIGAAEAQALFVSNTNDGGAGSLRQAVTDANANGVALDDVLFDLPSASTINLLSRLPNPVSGGALNLLGPGANQLTITGSNANQLFSFTAPGHLGMSQLQLSAFRGVDGPALEVYQSEVHLTSLQVTANQASRDGGAMLIGAADAVIESCTFAGNTATSNHGAIAYYGDNSRLQVRNSTFSGNNGLTSSAIGNVAIGAGPSVLDVESSTLAGNFGSSALTSVSLSSGAAVSSARNTLFVGSISNIANSGANASFVSRGFNLSSTFEALLTHPSDHDNARANLGPLQNNGGSTMTRALRFPSDAIDTGTRTSNFDQRGMLRPVQALTSTAPNSDGNDIGAYELQTTDLMFRNGFE